ncbi:MAG TPA: protease inhibitor I42 family protein, partial [Methanomicrobiales archaeon]|nr:protease inhibitor I42 family protein [Methanomicrobiales archaeon]
MTGRTIFISLALVCMAAAVLFAGCTTPGGNIPATPVPTTPVPATTQRPAGTGSFDQSNDGGTYPISRGAEIELRLPENPTTGFSWNLSLSTGLSLINDSYIPSDTTGKLVGSGGTHVWFLSANLPGGQTVSGTYRRPWEPAGPGVTFFTLNLIVEEGSCGPNVCTLPTTPSTVPPAYPVYTEADTGKAVQESRGGTFAIRLPENPSTGYSWNLSLPAGITLARDEYIPPQTAGQTVGRGGTRSFTLVADKTGTGNITTEYRRPWVPAGTVTR